MAGGLPKIRADIADRLVTAAMRLTMFAVCAWFWVGVYILFGRGR